MAVRQPPEFEHAEVQAMLIHSARRVNLPSLSVYLHSTPVEHVQNTKFLGVYINDTLTWHEHVQQVSSTVSRNLNLLWWLSWFPPKSALLVFYCFYILPSFDYCDVVLHKRGGTVLGTLAELCTMSYSLSTLLAFS